jgi:hypothetical protein
MIVHRVDSFQDPESAIRDAGKRPRRDSEEVPEDVQREIVGKHLQNRYRRWLRVRVLDRLDLTREQEHGGLAQRQTSGGSISQSSPHEIVFDRQRRESCGAPRPRDQHVVEQRELNSRAASLGTFERKAVAVDHHGSRRALDFEHEQLVTVYRANCARNLR